MLRILDTAITLTFHTIIAVAAVLVAFFWIIDTIKRYYHWLRGKRYRSMFVPPPRKRKRLVDANRLSPPQASRLAWPSAHGVAAGKVARIIVVPAQVRRRSLGRSTP